MFVRWSDINSAGKEGLAVNRFLDKFFCLAREQACHLALVARVEVLHYYNCGELRAEAAQYRAQGRQTPGRRANGDELTPRLGTALSGFRWQDASNREAIVALSLRARASF